MSRRNRVAAAAVVAACTVVLPAATAHADGLPCDQYDAACANALPRTDFYDAPSDGPHGGPGTLLRAERFFGYDLDDGVSATRILYRSRGAGTRDAAVSGVVLVPSGPRPAGGWPVIAYGHGTTGVATKCAPSLMSDLYHGSQLSALLRKGFAVVATDYAGLGGTGAHELVEKNTQAHNILDALPAARAAVPGLSRRWVAYGHSQGGTAVMGVAELMHKQRDPGYLGTVSTAPASQLTQMVDSIAHNPYASGFLPLLVAGVHAAHPAMHEADILSERARRLYPVVEHSCLNSALGAYAGLTGPDLVKADYLKNPYLSEYLQAGEPTGRAVRGPVLLLQGDADTLVKPEYTAALAHSLSGGQAAVQYRTYPGLAHDTLPGTTTGIDDGAMPDILNWIGDRFAAPRTG